MKLKGSLNSWKVIVVLGLITLLLFLKNKFLVDLGAILLGAIVYWASSYLVKDKGNLAKQEQRVTQLQEKIGSLKKEQTKELEQIDEQENKLVSNLKKRHFPYQFPNSEDLSVQTYEISTYHNQQTLVIRKIYDAKSLKYQLIYNSKGHILQFWHFLTPDTYTRVDFRENPPKFEYHSNYQGTIDLHNLPAKETIEAQLTSKNWYYQQLKNKLHHQVVVIKKIQDAASNWFLRKDSDGHWFKDDLANKSLINAETVSRKYFGLDHDNNLSKDNILGLKEVQKYYLALNKELAEFNKLKEQNFKTLDLVLPEKTLELTEHDITSLSNKYAGELGELLVDKKLRQIGQGKYIGHNVILPYPYDNKGPSLNSNQIDNLVVSNKGIFCIETKVRTITSRLYNVSSGYQDISSQIAKHRDAIGYALRKSDNPVIKNLLKKPAGQYLVHNLVVFISRSKQNFTFKNSELYTQKGAHVLKLADVQLVVSNGVKTDVPVSLTDEEVKAIGEVLIEKSKDRANKGHAGNLVFWGGEVTDKEFKEIINKVTSLTKELQTLNEALKHLIGLEHELETLKAQEDALKEVKAVDKGFAQAKAYYNNQLQTHDYTFIDAITKNE
ncbi:NERD domain-containing protein [Lactobacillus sp. PV037]|uniref:nuclease-related domain-containing protein n=1 Tax=unclassified Lactobacillus TaxID=2620435 RepID=UPI002240C461|nr:MULTISPECIES: nuclease-related domain-containing protein [unclassified Lactobacillus]QNQ82394.1 NERD domain-containing protein [Lactobacillus sp. PV012]QNQ83492.1 NERD domain-containing protein [Lactobacillus sp. PV037]